MLAQRLRQLGHPKVLVIGDLLIEREIHGTVDFGHPVSLFVEQSRSERMGGAGMVAQMAFNLGADVELLACDNPAVREQHFDDDRLVFRINRPGGGRFAYPQKAQEIARDIVQWADVVLFADHAGGSCEHDLVRAAIREARRRGILTIAEPAPITHLELFAGVDCLKLSTARLRLLFESTYGCPLAFPRFTRRIVGDGHDGLKMVTGSWPAKIREFLPAALNVVDPACANDMALAALAVCIAGGMSWEEACIVAVAAAGLAVERHGAVPLALEAVAKALESQSGSQAQTSAPTEELHRMADDGCPNHE